MNENIAVSNPQSWIPEVSINLSGFQVARREFFAHTYNPALFLTQGAIQFNGPCLKSMPDVSHIQILIDSDEKLIAIRPSNPDEKDVLRWCSGQRHTPRLISCPLFYFKVISLMNWNPELRYKLLGKLVRAKDERLMLFDLTHPVAQKRHAPSSNHTTNGTKFPVRCFQDYYPEEWLTSFGIPEQEHQTRMSVATFNGHTIFGMPSDFINSTHDSPTETEVTST